MASPARAGRRWPAATGEMTVAQPSGDRFRVVPGARVSVARVGANERPDGALPDRSAAARHGAMPVAGRDGRGSALYVNIAGTIGSTMRSPWRSVTSSLLLLLLLLAPRLGHGADPALIESLRAGGFILYVRHAATDWSQTDRRRDAGWESCDPGEMRQLSAAGRDVARRVGEAMRRLRVPVGRVVASEFCRTRETARLLGLGVVETSRDLLNATHAEHAGGTEALRRGARRLLATQPPYGLNTVLVSHGNVFRLVSDRRPAEGGVAIVQPDGRGGFRVLGHVAPKEWTELAGAR